MKKKTYKVDDVRRAAPADGRGAGRRPEQSAQKEQAREETAEPDAEREADVEIDFDVKDTGQKKADQRLRHAPGRHDDHGPRERARRSSRAAASCSPPTCGWSPTIAAMKEVVDFDMRYAQKLVRTDDCPARRPRRWPRRSRSYPMMAPAMAKMRAEGVKMDGTAILTTLTFDAVKSAEQARGGSRRRASRAATAQRLGGIAGGLMRGARRRRRSAETDETERRARR